MEAAKKQLAEWDAELDQLHARNGDLGLEVQNLQEELRKERADREEIKTELADLKQNSAPASELPEAADLLNRLKAKRKKSAVTLADIEAILGMIEES